MADHIPLPPGVPLESRRARGNPVPPRVVNRQSHGPVLADQLAEASAADEQTEDIGGSVVLKIFGSTRLESGLYRDLDLVRLGEGEDWTYVVLSSRDSRIRLGELLSEYSGMSPEQTNDWDHPATWARMLDNIDGIGLYGSEDRRDPGLAELTFDTPEILDVLLWPSDRSSLALQRVESINAVVQRASQDNRALRVVAFDPRPQTTVVRIVADRALMEMVLEEAWVERVRPPLKTPFTTVNLASAEVPAELPSPSGAAVGVVDGFAVTANPLLAQTVVDTASFPKNHGFSSTDAHGTAVASIAAWGDLDFLIEKSPAPVPHPVVSARVLEENGSSSVDLVGTPHLTIEEAVRWLVEAHHVRVINISINRNHPVDTLLPSELTATIDSLSRELNVVLVVSAGNRLTSPADGWLEGYPRYLTDDESGIAEPGDAALAVTVGATSRRDVPGSLRNESLLTIAPARGPAPFTRTGPSRGHTAVGTLKPEFVHHGGNWAYDHSFGSVQLNDPGLAVVTAIPPTGGRFVGMNTGTSFAAPAVAREVARIATRYPDASANLLRALTALSAKQPSPRQVLDGLDPLRISAYGEPDADRVLESAGPSAILTIDATISTNSVVVHSLPVPYEFAMGASRRTLRIALAYDPPVRRSRKEYTAGQMSVEVVRGIDLEDVQRRYQRQPSIAQARADPTVQRLRLPSGRFRPSLVPGSSRLVSNTLIRRDFLHGSWDPDDEHYFLVVTHNQSPWSASQRGAYTDQDYAIAVQLLDEERQDLDLHALVKARARAEARIVERLRLR